ncbi:hypothetical protein ACEPAI_6885 [Sanghuangporus weigelae]
MSARFAELMALSAAQTQDSVAATQQIIQEKRRKEEQRNKEQMEKDKRDREFQVRLIKKKLEEQQQAEERKQKQEEDRRRKEELIRQREEEQRRNLVYGKDRRAGGSSGGGARSRKGHGGSDDDGEDVGGLVLTREEKRQRKLLSDLNKSFPSARKGHSSPTSQILKRSYRAGAATNLSESSSRSQPRHPQQGGSGSNAESLSNIRKKLAAMPPTLMRLGTTKRDVRTIDEIVTDLQKKKEVKVIDGEEARKNGFDWFGEQKKMKKAAPVPSLSPSPETRASQSPRPRSKERVASLKSSASTQPRINGAGAHTSERKEPRTKVTIVKPDPVDLLSFSKINKGNNSTSTKSTVSSKSATSHVSHVSSNTGKQLSSAYRKRARSDSFSDDSLSDDGSPPPVKRRPARSSTRNDISSEIWKLFGKDRSQYIQNDVFSDEDDDMEADAEALRREEMRSARLAKKEDELAEEEEKRHEEEKRRKKKEKERRGY